MNDRLASLPRTRPGLEPEEKAAIKERGVLLSGLGYLIILGTLVVYRITGVTDAAWPALGWVSAATAVEVALLWAAVHLGWERSLEWDPDFIYLPLAGTALLLGLYLYVVPEARDVMLVAWFVALLFGAGMLGLRGLLGLGALVTGLYGAAVYVHASQGGPVDVPREATRVGLLVAMHGFAGLVFSRLRRSREEKRRLREDLEREAVTDPLTGLHNRRFLMEKLRSEVERLERYGGTTSVVMLDLDYFKRYNDAHGHVAGDRVLAQLARICQEEARGADVVARYGGEEFTLVLPRTPWREARRAAERLRRVIVSASFEGEEVLPGGELTVSLGVAGYPEHAESADQLIQVADRALYRAKERGRNRVCVPGEAEPSPASQSPSGSSPGAEGRS